MKNAKILWFTGLSGAGKTTIASKVAAWLKSRQKKILVLDGDIVRTKINRNLSFSPEDIRKNNALVAKLCKKYKSTYDYIFVVLISPFKSSRLLARRLIGKDFHEVYIKASLKEVMRRDTKGLYRKALKDEVAYVIGVDKRVPYQPPQRADVILDTEKENIRACVDKLKRYIKNENHFS